MIRKALHSDIETIATFQVEMAFETENLILDKETVVNGVSHILNHPETGQYFVAEMGGNVVASLLTLYEWSDWRNGNVIWIHSVYVLPEFRKNGIFKQMYSSVKQMVENDETLRGIRLFVDKTNLKAIQVYQNVGMNGEHYQLFEWIKA